MSLSFAWVAKKKTEGNKKEGKKSVFFLSGLFSSSEIKRNEVNRGGRNNSNLELTQTGKKKKAKGPLA